MVIFGVVNRLGQLHLRWRRVVLTQSDLLRRHERTMMVPSHEQMSFRLPKNVNVKWQLQQLIKMVMLKLFDSLR